jgi:hypothetical protein
VALRRQRQMCIRDSYPAAGQRTVNLGSTVTFLSGTVTVNHSASTGSGSWTFSGRLLMQNPYPGTSFMPPDMTTTTGTIAATDFNGPSAPNQPTLTRSSDGATINITSAVPASPGTMAITKYQFQYSLDGTNWAGFGDLSTTSGTFNAVTTQPYYIQTRAVSNQSYAWGTGSWSSSTYIAGVPVAPSSISLSTSGRSVRVTVGASSSDGGATASYQVAYSGNGGADSAYQSASGTPITTTFSNLTPNTTYTFAARATNSTGASTTTTSTSVFIPSGGRIFDGTNWNLTNGSRRWDGTSWINITSAKRFDGTNWVDLT